MVSFIRKYAIYLILLAALLLRLPEYFISLAYDEIWTWQHFAPLSIKQIFFDLTLPNNHPLNTLLVKFTALLPLPPEAVRFPNLLAALGSILLTGFLVQTRRGKNAALWSMFFLAASAPHLVYSVQARGYILQIFFLLLYAAGLIKTRQAADNRRICFYASAAIAGAVGAMTTLATSCLYLCAITVILWNLNNFAKVPRRIMVTLAISAILSLLYIFINLSDLITARQWGEKIVSASGFFAFAGNRLYMTIFPLLLIFIVPGLIKLRQAGIGSIFFLLLIFGSALFTHAGPARVYLPLTVAGTMLAGIGADESITRIKRRDLQQLFSAAAVALALLSWHLQMPQWRFPDYFPVIGAVSEQPGEVLTIYPAADSYPVLINSAGRAAERYDLELNHYRLSQLVLINSSGTITGGDKNFSQQSLPMPLAGKTIEIGGLNAVKYLLEPVKSVPVDAPVIAVSYSKSSVVRLAGEENILMLNIFFSNAPLPDNRRLTAGSWYIKPGALNKYAAKGLPETLSENIRLYQIKTPQQ